ncbi:MAG: small multi-drug export protein [Patescibacteria group bacterium]|nr:small multi-drug export protein [Patescibacteria group bacterium]
MIPEVQTFFLAMTPIGELRAAIPVGLTLYHLNWLRVFLISVIGNLVPVILLLLFLAPASAWLSRNFKIFQRFFSWLFERTRRRYNSKMKKYGYPGLAVFVAIPLPLTGGWTACLIAFLFGIPFKIALPLIAFGVAIAGVIVSLLTQAGIAVEKYFGWPVLLFILALGLIVWLLKSLKIKSLKID